MIWKFFLDGNEVEQPTNWDSFEYLLKRSDNYTGLENVYADKQIRFWRTGAAYIKSKFNQLGFEGFIEIKIQAICAEGVSDEINGVLNLFNYAEENNQVLVTLEESGFSAKFKNRMDTPINFSDNKSLDDIDLPSADYYDLKLHSKAIVYQNKFIQNNLSATYNDTKSFAGSLHSNFIYFPLITSVDETGGMNDIALPYDNLGVGAQIQPVFIAPFASTFTFNYKLKGYFTIYNYGGTFSFNHNIAYEVGDGILPGELISTTVFRTGTGVPLTRIFDESGSITLAMNAGDRFSIFQRIFNVTNDADFNATLLSVWQESTLDIYTESIFSPSECLAIDIFSAFKRTCQSITGQLDCFRSDYFGRPDIYPFPRAIGCGAYTAVTNGLNIRNMLDKNGEKFPITMSFNELYEAANAVWGIGMRIEYNAYGKGFIRVENHDYFYNAEHILTFTNVSNIGRSVAQDLIYNEAKIGYEQWNLNISGTNAIDEFNSIHNYSLPVINAKRVYERVSKFITSGYVIEFTRRQQYKIGGTKDFETDNNNFFISTNREDLTVDGIYGVGIKKYRAGTISERAEDFTSIENLLNPESSYNLRLSPTRNLIRQYGAIAASLFGKSDPVIRFQSGEGNFQEKDDMISNGCEDATGQISQDQNIEKIILIDPNAIYKPVYISFETPLTFDKFINIRKKSQYAIQVSCGTGGLTSAFIKELRFLPNKDGGVGQFKVLEAVCRSGAFDGGYDDGFDIGTC